MDLFWIISFPIAFIIHDAEEIFVQHKWMLTHKEDLIKKFPKAKKIIHHLSSLTTKAFTIAVLEELILLVFATVYIFAKGPFSNELWTALFMAFSVHFLVHMAQGIIIRSYTPGLATSILMLPYVYFGINYICEGINYDKLALLSIIGIMIMIINLKFAHRLAKFFLQG